jgi:uncharacterized protein YacL
MMSHSLARHQAVAFLTGATFGAVLGLMLGSLAGASLAQAAVAIWRWVREEVLHQEDEVDFELLLQ